MYIRVQNFWKKAAFNRYRLLLIIFCFTATICKAQETIVKGKITDANSGDPIPYVNVIFQETTVGATSDFDGNYELRTTSPTDSIVGCDHRDFPGHQHSAGRGCYQTPGGCLYGGRESGF
jgi:hypothetical protein